MKRTKKIPDPIVDEEVKEKIGRASNRFLEMVEYYKAHPEKEPPFAIKMYMQNTSK